MCATECGFLSMIGIAVMSLAFLSLAAVIVSLIIAVLGWAWSFNELIKLSKRDAYDWLDAEPIREVGGDS